MGDVIVRPLAAAERETRRTAVLARIKETALKRAEELLNPDLHPAVRDMTNTALAVLVAGEDPSIAEQLLIRAFSLQDMDPASPTFGYVPWNKGDADIRRDPNSIEFATHSMGPILQEYGDKLSASFKREIDPHIRAAFSALRLHNPPVWYTNIYLMNTINMILMGEAVGDKQAADDGYAQLDIWLEYTHKSGIHEYDSPTYYAVDLDSLRTAYVYVKRPEGRAKFKAILDYFHADMCANFFPAYKRLSGPHSRNYDFLGGTGGMNAMYWFAGLVDGEYHGGSAYLYLGTGDRGYVPGEEILSMAAIAERVIASTWDLKPGGRRYSYMTRDFVIGSSSMSYEPQDRPIAVELKSAKPLPVMVMMADTFDAPYGKVKYVDPCGHTKSFHWSLNPTAVQEKGTMMVLADPNPSKMDEVETVAVNIVLPLEADSITFDGAQVSIDKPFEIPMRPDSVAAVREGNSAVVVRVMFAEGCEGRQAEPVLKVDEAGIESGAARVAIYTYHGEKKRLSDMHARAAVLLIAEHCGTDEEFTDLVKRAKNAKFVQKTENGVWEAQVEVGGLKLEAGQNSSDHQSAYRRVNGEEMIFGLLTVNGRDMSYLLPQPSAALTHRQG